MSLRYIRAVSLKCDVCGITASFGRNNDMTARVLAQRQGWKYAIYLAAETEIENGARRFAFDACPECDLPQQLAPLAILIESAPGVARMLCQAPGRTPAPGQQQQQ